ncbi:MAG: CDP-archaeol synthase, partial [Sulfolobaceae archaeon]
MYVVYNEIVTTILIYLPAFAANGGAVFVSKGTPIDFRKNFIDNKRILGDGKTFEGLLLSLTFGTSVGVIIARFLGTDFIIISAVESLFAMLGDMLGAFIKRRLGLPRGYRVLVLDQLDFVFGASIGLLIMGVNLSILGIGIVG